MGRVEGWFDVNYQVSDTDNSPKLNPYKTIRRCIALRLNIKLLRKRLESRVVHKRKAKAAMRRITTS